MLRYELERHVDRAQLPGPAAAILRALVQRINTRSGEIPGHAQPSLSRLSELTGYHRSTIARWLGWLDREGWITRDRPPAWLARTQHVTTAYTVHAPAGYKEASRRRRPALVALRDKAGRTERPALVADDDAASRSGRHKTESQQREEPRRTETSSDDDPRRAVGEAVMAGIAISELRELTGRTLTAEQGREVARLVLEGRDVQHPGAYLRAALREQPKRYLPAGDGPPTWAERQAELAAILAAERAPA